MAKKPTTEKETVVTSGPQPTGKNPDGGKYSTALTTKPQEPENKISVYTGGDSVPDFMRDRAGAGTESFSTEDVPLPRLKLLQGLSPELEKFNTAKMGDFFHAGAEIVVPTPYRIIPIYSDLRYILWNPRESGGGILARADDGKMWNPADTEFKVRLDKRDGGHDVVWKTAKTVAGSGLHQWGSQNRADPKSPPAATKMFNFLFAFPDFPDLEPAIFSFQRSSLKMGAQFIHKIRTMPKAPMWGTVFTVDSETANNKKGDKFKVPILTASGVITSRSLFEEYTALHDLYVSTGFKAADIETAQTADDAPDDGGAADDPNAPSY